MSREEAPPSTEELSFSRRACSARPEISIAGAGLVTPLGLTLDETWAALLTGRFIETHGTVPIDSDARTSRVAQLALLAAREALADANWTASDDVALIVATSKGAIVDWIIPPPYMAKSPYEAGRLGWGLSALATDLARNLKLGYGPRLTLSAACATGLHALIRAVMMLRTGEAKRAIVVAAEASVHELFIHSFQRLGVLPKPGIGCRPFDLHRDGFLMSESAAAVCLQTTPSSSIGRPIVAIDRFALGGDATHLTGADPTGQTLRHLLAQTPGPFDLIHAHGTGTEANDPIELAALETFATPANTPTTYSHKGALGHSLGAAGLVAVALNFVAHREGVIPGNVRTDHPLPTGLELSRYPVHRPIKRSLATAAGFGGATAVVSLVSVH